jgi:hypothetical protein
MTNVFLSDFYTRLRNWHNLKEDLKDADTETICVEVDRFWQQCPMVTHYLHPADVKDWPNPWNLLNDNMYCQYARALGMVYTLLLLGIEDIDIVEAIDDHSTYVVLVLVDRAKYVMNWFPDSVLNTTLSAFELKRSIDIIPIQQKVGLL